MARDRGGGGRAAGVEVRVHHVVPALGEEAAQRADVAQGQPPLDQRPGQDVDRHVRGTQLARPDAGRGTRHLHVPPAGPECDREVDDIALGAGPRPASCGARQAAKVCGASRADAG